MSASSEWVDKYGKPFADYEIRAIDGDDYFDREDAIHLLGFDRMDALQAVSCDTCGAVYDSMFVRHLRAHRRLCGWDNGSPAVWVKPGGTP